MLNKIFKSQIVLDTISYCEMMQFSDYTCNLMLEIAYNLPRNTKVTPAEIATKICAHAVNTENSQDAIYGRSR